jgi:hypothetical protein
MVPSRFDDFSPWSSAFSQFHAFFGASSRLKLLSPRIKSADGMSARFWSAPVLWRFSTVFHIRGSFLFASFPCCVEPLCFPPQMPPLSVPSVVKPFGCGFPALCILAAILFGCRYAWAERAKTVAYPERFAQEALGHNTKPFCGRYSGCRYFLIPVSKSSLAYQFTNGQAKLPHA